MNNLNNFSDGEVLDYLIHYDKIKLSDVEEAMKKEKVKEILKIHPYKIYQSSDGRWKTQVLDTDKKEKRRMIVKTRESDLYDVLYEHYFPEEKKEPTIADLYPDWLTYKELNGAASTYIKKIDSHWKKYYMNTSLSTIPIRNLDTMMLKKWALNLIRDNNLTSKEYTNVSMIVRQILLYAVDLHIISSSPFEYVKIKGKNIFRKVKKKPSNTQTFSHDEVEKITEFAWADFYNQTKVYVLSPLALIFQFQTGMRIGEICALKYEDIETEDEIHVQRMVRRDEKTVVEHTKTDAGDRYIILTDEAKKIIKTCKDYQENIGVSSKDYIFSINDKALTERSISDLYRKYCNWLGIINKSSHKARKTFISTLLDNQVNINTVRELVGHVDERTTLNSYCYDRRTDQHKKEFVRNALKDL